MWCCASTCKGAATLKRLIPEAVFIFLTAPSEEELVARLSNRKTESPESLRIRIATAREELQRMPEFDYVVVNPCRSAGGSRAGCDRYHPRRALPGASTGGETVNQYQTPAPPPQPAALRLPTYRPRVTYVMMGILVVVFVIETLAGGSEKPRVLISLGANVGPLVTTGEYWRLFTANFLHIGLLHIAFNLYALYIVGTEVEMFYGPWRFLVIYLLSGLSGAIGQLRFHVRPVGGRVYRHLRLDRHAVRVLYAQSRGLWRDEPHAPDQSDRRDRHQCVLRAQRRAPSTTGGTSAASSAG